MATVLIVDTSQSKKAIFAVFWLLIAIRTTTGTLLKFPKDQSVTAGQSVTFECQTDLNLPVFWYFNNHEIFYGGKVSMSFHNMFKVSTDGTGVYDLVISSADKTYNGEYICGDDEGQGERRSARLNVTDLPTTAANEQSASTSSDNEKIMIIVLAVLGVVAVVGIVIASTAYLIHKRSQTKTKPDNEKDVEIAPAKKGRNEWSENEVNAIEKEQLLTNENERPDPLDAHKKVQLDTSSEPAKIGFQGESKVQKENSPPCVKKLKEKFESAQNEKETPWNCKMKNMPAGSKPVVTRDGNHAPNTKLSAASEPTIEGPTANSTALGTSAGDTENMASDTASSILFKATNDITSPTASKMNVSHEAGSTAADVAAGDKEETALAPLTVPNSTDGDATVGSSAAGDPADDTVQSAPATTLPNVSMATNEGLAAGCTGIGFSADVREQSARDETVSEPTSAGHTGSFSEIGSPAGGTVQYASKVTSLTTPTATVVEPAKKKPPILSEKPNKKDDCKGRMIN